jgi:methyltransferase (TIGR00027 family)
MPRLQSGQPSVTAWKVALRRAAHQLADHPPVFADPLAVPILGPDGAAAIRDPRLGGDGAAARALRAFMAVRSRLAEDRLARLYAEGVRQYLVLGAGLDTFAYRSPWPDLQVFEVDHPATQAWKRGRLQDAGIPVPPSLTLAPVDFERQVLADELAAAGFRAEAGAMAAWLGVVPYLTEPAVFDTLGYVAGFAPGSEVVFDFGVAKEELGLGARLAQAAIAARVAAAGEPFRCYFSPAGLSQRMRALGFSEAEVLDSAALNARYFVGRDDGLRLGEGGGRLMRARV